MPEQTEFPAGTRVACWRDGKYIGIGVLFDISSWDTTTCRLVRMTHGGNEVIRCDELGIPLREQLVNTLKGEDHAAVSS